MIFEQLQCFLVVARLGSIGRASQEMFLAQPLLTARIKALEREVGTDLFVRTKSGMHLTEEGREFLPYAERCVSVLEGGKQHLKEMKEGKKGHLKLGVLPRVGTYMLPTFLEEFSSAYPHIFFSVLTGHSQYILDMVLAEEVHVGLARPMSHPEVENTLLYEEELVLVVSPKHRFARRESVEFADVGHEQLILFDRDPSNIDLANSLYRDMDLAQARTAELDNTEAAKRMVENGLGVSFLPRIAVSRAVAAGRLCVVEVNDAPKLKRSVVALRRKDAQITGVAATFLEKATQISRTFDQA